MYDIIWKIYHTWYFHCCMYQISDRRFLLCEQKISYTDVSEITSEVIWSLKWALWPHINILLHFSCGRKGSQLLFYVTSPNMYANHCKRKQWHEPKIILNRDLAIRSFISVFIWQQNLHLILLFIANNVIYVKFLFLGSVLPHKLIWDSLYYRGMICYLCFRKNTRFTNIIAIHMYCTVLLFISMIFVALTNR